MARIWGCVCRRLDRATPDRAAVAGGLCAVGLALAVQVALAGPATAHARLAGSSPEDSATIDRPPGEVTIELDAKPATIEGDPLQVYGPDGGRVDAGDPRLSDHGRRLTVTLDQGRGLAGGPYEIAYRVVSADSHVIAGHLSFTARLPADATGTAGAASPAGAVALGNTSHPSEVQPDDTLDTGSDNLLPGGPRDLRPALVAAGASGLAAFSLLLRLLRRPGRRGRPARPRRVERPAAPARRAPAAGEPPPHGRRPDPDRGWDRPHHPRRDPARPAGGDDRVQAPLAGVGASSWDVTADAAGYRQSPHLGAAGSVPPPGARAAVHRSRRPAGQSWPAAHESRAPADAAWTAGHGPRVTTGRSRAAAEEWWWLDAQERQWR